MIFISSSEKETIEFAKSLAGKIKPGNIFLVEGSLGVGKSVFIRGVARGLGVIDSMPSPTFTIVNEYKAAGEYFVDWNGKDISGNTVASGTYFYQMHIGDFSSVKKSILLR